MICGLDFLGIAKYQKRALQTLPEHWAVGMFAETFGDAFPIAKKLIEEKRCAALRVHLVWKDNHTFGQTELAQAKKLAAKWGTLAGKGVPLYISPFCEHQLTNPDSILEQIQAVAPGAFIVNTPSIKLGGKGSKKFKNEVHGDEKERKQNYIYSFDGESCVDANVEKRKAQHKNADIFFFWVPQFNGRTNENDLTPRPDRQAWPVKDLIESVKFLANNKGKTNLASAYLWKSHADQDDSPKPERRVLKPVFISPKKFDYYELRDRHQNTVAKLKYFGPFDGGGYRYYLNRYGYKVAQKDQSLVLSLWDSLGNICGFVNPGFRENKYR